MARGDAQGAHTHVDWCTMRSRGEPLSYAWRDTPMYPELMHIEAIDLTIRSYPTLILIAAVVCIWIGPHWAARLEGLDARRLLRALLVINVFVFAGARLHFVVTHWSMFRTRPLEILEFWSGGIHAGGAIAGLVISAPLVLHHYGVPLAKFADGFAPTVGIGIAIARLGCFLQGCCFGTVCRWPWGISFPPETYAHSFHQSLGIIPADAAHTAPVHPLQLYFSAAGLMLTALALWLHPRKRYDGQVGLMTLVAYSIGSALLELLRADYQPRTYWGPLPQLEWVALALTALSLSALLYAERRHGHPRATAGR
jgi:phosphatidylglycerol:prolipoprotein diacylglycerol transferase